MNNRQHITEISDLLTQAAQQVKMLRRLAWPHEVEEEFFRNKAEKLPSVCYEPYDPAPVLEQVRAIRRRLDPQDPVDAWARGIADKIEGSALLLGAVGTPDFFRYSEFLFGKPSDPLQNGSSSTLDLALHFDQIFSSIAHFDLGAPPEACYLASALASDMETAVRDMFGELAPEVVLDPELASNAIAGRRRISIRPTACFTDKDVGQLIHHEAFIHVATSLNGDMQPHLKVLGSSHAGTTKTQEGLAIFAEFITGSTDLDRLRRLSDRVFAIQMAIDGADFMEVYRYFLERTDAPGQAFQNARRVFRGGMVTGRVPFTKDIVYLEGLVNVHSFLRIAVSQGKVDHLDLLFSGKLDLFDLPALKQLFDMGLIAKPRFLPPWFRDKRFLISYLSYSSFLDNLQLSDSHAFYEAILK